MNFYYFSHKGVCKYQYEAITNEFCTQDVKVLIILDELIIS